MVDYASVLEKKCSRCLLVKGRDEFSLRDTETGRLQSQCQLCTRIINNALYAREQKKYRAKRNENTRRDRSTRRAFILEYLKGRSCLICSESDPVVLEFDHRDRSTKLNCVSKIVQHGTLHQLQVEVAKCDILCANCHRKKTARELGFYKERSL